MKVLDFKLEGSVFSYVRERCFEFCEQHELEPLIISDNGSKAWGYDSPISDRDILVLFKHKSSEYRNFFLPTDYYGFKPSEDFDFKFWDINKYFQLLWKCNAQTYELVCSPWIYYEDTNAGMLRDLTKIILLQNLQYVYGHYYGLAKKTYKERVAKAGEVTSKKYLYIIRPLLHCHEIETNNCLPELNFEKCLTANKDIFTDEQYALVLDLLAQKRSGNLTMEHKGRYDALDQFCEEHVNKAQARLNNWPVPVPVDNVKNKEVFNNWYKYYTK